MSLVAEIDLAPRPLVVDLDGTLIRSDMLVETFFALLSSKPLRGLMALLSLRHGRAALKARLASEATLDLSGLPLNEALVAFLRAEKAKGRRIYLATAADERLARGIADRLGLFDGVFASNGILNLKGANKAAVLREAFGDGGFDYAGDAAADLDVWKDAGEVILVNADRGLTRTVTRRFPEARIIAPRTTSLSDYRRALRIHQWIKNLLVFIPAFTAHRFDAVLGPGPLLAFLSFSLCASSVYVLNDLLDLRNDRDHPVKRHRPFASGRIDVLNGLWIAPASLLLAALLTLFLPAQFALTLVIYYGLTLAYSMVLKRQMALDVIVLACLYGMRLLAGAAAVGVVLSPWLVTFAIFFFLGLALVKRWGELLERVEKGKGDPAGRGYRNGDLPILQTMAAASGYIAVLIFGLYINSPTVAELYSTPDLLWIIPLILLYWLSRVLIITHRGEMHDDPVVFAAKDGTSIACAVLMGLVLVMAI
ncbi:MAG: UbiA family prenyltransferase [Alphaproteobacteria bacterium]|nr:UbiA family prenyltransferase [Alphaproteobacteria bacterium]